MPTASESCVVSKWWLFFAKLALLPGTIVSGDQRSNMACPSCKRVYGGLPTYPELNAQRVIVKCTCGKRHLGYKPFDGYQ